MRSSLQRRLLVILLHFLDDLLSLVDSSCSLLGFLVAIETETDANAAANDDNNGGGSATGEGSAVSSYDSDCRGADLLIKVETHEANVVQAADHLIVVIETSEAGFL